MTTPTWPGLLTQLIAGQDLAASETGWAMDQIMAGEATPAQIAGFMVALRVKGETPAELDGLAASMLDHAERISVPGALVDIVGTGGDRAHTVNISTMAALVVAGAGHRVVKHGNRAASSACGSADVLEELGVRLTLEPSAVAKVAETVGITFCFAQVFHPAFRHTAAPRRELGIPSAFNFLGPLTNPAQPGAQAIGCADPRMAPLMAAVLARRGVSALLFRGDDGLDELTTYTTSRVWWVRDGAVTETSIDPAALGIVAPAPGALVGGDAATNAAAVRDLLAGNPGPVRDAVLLNAAAALVAIEPDDRPLIEQLRSALAVAAAAVDSGAAAQVLDRWVSETRALS